MQKNKYFVNIIERYIPKVFKGPDDIIENLHKEEGVWHCHVLVSSLTNNFNIIISWRVVLVRKNLKQGWDYPSSVPSTVGGKW